MCSEANDNIRILSNEKVGRYVVANRDLKQGEVIFSEAPFAFGPKTDSVPQCLGCFAPTDCKTLCSKCGWPVCGPSCEENIAHSEAECKVFSSAKVKFQPVEDITTPCPQFDCIMHLRILAAKEKYSERWEKEVKVMEAHNELRKSTPEWNINKINVVDFLLERCKLKDKGITDELLHTICGIIEVNAFEGRTPNGYAVRILYPKLALLLHNCVSNISHSIVPLDDNGEQYRVHVRAAVNIPKDGELFSSYTYSMAPTITRRVYLKQSKHFDCDCPRCSDPTELGTYMSSMKCQRCDPGIIISTNPLNNEAMWKCSNSKCDYQVRGETIRKVFNTVQQELEQLEISGMEGDGIEQREQVFGKYRSVLHLNHAFMTTLRHSLSQMYGRVEGYMLEDLPDILLERKSELCKDLLKVLNVIEPGYSRIRGMTLYELPAPIIFLAKNMYRSGMIDKAGLRKQLMEAIEVLEEATAILSFEHPSCPEGIIGVVAAQSLQQVKENIDFLVENT